MLENVKNQLSKYLYQELRRKKIKLSPKKLERKKSDSNEITNTYIIKRIRSKFF